MMNFYGGSHSYKLLGQGPRLHVASLLEASRRTRKEHPITSASSRIETKILIISYYLHCPDDLLLFESQ